MMPTVGYASSVNTFHQTPMCGISGVSILPSSPTCLSRSIQVVINSHHNKKSLNAMERLSTCGDHNNQPMNKNTSSVRGQLYLENGFLG
jgi:hypothetical protein